MPKMITLKLQIVVIVIYASISGKKCFELPSLNDVGSFVKRNTYCKWKECCTNKEIPARFDELERTLQKKLYGQHIVLDNLVNILSSHWMTDSSQKALTISFHGWTGGGKNYVARFIQNHLYARGAESDHVHHFMGRIHFPLENKVHEYKQNLYQWIKGNVSNCPKQLFVFDEVDKMPAGLLDVIKPLIDYNDNIDKVDYRQSIFIFLSNTGGSDITEYLLDAWRAGKQRENIRLQDFEKLILQGAFNEQGGFHHSDTIKSNLIDHYIPFLPLQREHVRLCIIDEFKNRNVASPTDADIVEIMAFIEWGPDATKVYSKTGCKRLSQKVALVADRYFRHKRTEL